MITRDTDYAIRALGCIAGSDKSAFSVRDLTKQLGIPRPFLRKLLQVLTKKGFLKSYKGKGGGFVLVKDPKKITVFDLVQIFQGPFQLSEHIIKKEVCPNIKTCKLKRHLDKIEKHVIKQLKEFSISDFLK